MDSLSENFTRLYVGLSRNMSADLKADTPQSAGAMPLAPSPVSTIFRRTERAVQAGLLQALQGEQISERVTGELNNLDRFTAGAAYKQAIQIMFQLAADKETQEALNMGSELSDAELNEILERLGQLSGVEIEFPQAGTGMP